MSSEEHDEVATVVEAGPDSVPMHGDAAGLESRVLLARARGRLLGWSDEPTKVGRYRVLERIGTGGMGVIFAAQDDELDRPVAIKILRSDVGLGSAGRQRLLREAQAIARLSHPNIVHVYEVGQDEGQVYLAMELVRGPTLRRWCAEAKPPWADIVAMFAKIGEGLAAAHTAGIVHRDFKPDNALVGDDGRPRVIDFGLARPRADAGPTGENQVVPASESGSLASARLRELDVTVSGTVVGTPA
ncbi:MAG TPA: serine/threonine-protein kinase, partial [Nannocystaceae bacterium]|nr:serine/threonine-protein kinase [Nannocystaceae bacterium]